MAEPIKGVRKAPNVATTSADRFIAESLKGLLLLYGYGDSGAMVIRTPFCGL